MSKIPTCTILRTLDQEKRKLSRRNYPKTIGSRKDYLVLVAPEAFSNIWFCKGVYILTLSSARNIIIFTNFFHWCIPKDIYFATVTYYCNSFQFYNTKSSSYSFFLLSARFLLKARPTILLFALYFFNFLAKFCIFYT